MTHEQLIARLVDAVDNLASHVEDLGCTCGSTETRNRLHAPNRRRRDSRCTGVALAVQYRSLCRRARRMVHPWPYKQTVREALAALAEEAAPK